MIFFISYAHFFLYFFTSLQDLEEFVNGSGDDGFIVFSMGSMVSSMPLKKAELFLDAFRQIPQRVITIRLAHYTSMQVTLYRFYIVNLMYWLILGFQLHS